MTFVFTKEMAELLRKIHERLVCPRLMSPKEKKIY